VPALALRGRLRAGAHLTMKKLYSSCRWVVSRQPITVTTIMQLTPAHIAFQHNNKDRLKTTRPVQECEKEFEVLSTPRLLCSGIATLKDY